jgi:hypothetical protein
VASGGPAFLFGACNSSEQVSTLLFVSESDKKPEVTGKTDIGDFPTLRKARVTFRAKQAISISEDGQKFGWTGYNSYSKTVGDTTYLLVGMGKPAIASGTALTLSIPPPPPEKGGLGDYHPFYRVVDNTSVVLRAAVVLRLEGGSPVNLVVSRKLAAAKVRDEDRANANLEQIANSLDLTLEITPEAR